MTWNYCSHMFHMEKFLHLSILLFLFPVMERIQQFGLHKSIDIYFDETEVFPLKLIETSLYFFRVKYGGVLSTKNYGSI